MAKIPRYVINDGTNNWHFRSKSGIYANSSLASALGITAWVAGTSYVGDAKDCKNLAIIKMTLVGTETKATVSSSFSEKVWVASNKLTPTELTAIVGQTFIPVDVTTGVPESGAGVTVEGMHYPKHRSLS